MAESTDLIPPLSRAVDAVVPSLQRRLPQFEMLWNLIQTRLVRRLAAFERKLATDDYYKWFQELSRHTSVPPIYFFLIALGIGLSVVRAVMRTAADLLIDVAAIAYPAMKTLDYLERRNKSEDAEEGTQWSAYWVIFSLIKLLDYLKTVTRQIPLFKSTKLALLIWLMHPRTKGASVIYEQYIKGLWQKKEQLQLFYRLQQMLKPDDSGSSSVGRTRADSIDRFFRDGLPINTSFKYTSNESMANSLESIDGKQVNAEMAKFILCLGLAASALPNHSPTKAVNSLKISSINSSPEMMKKLVNGKRASF